MDIPKKLSLQQIELGPLNNFLYFIGDKETRDVAIVDPAWDVEYLCKIAEDNNYKISAIFLTHGHHDHVNGLKEMLSRYDVPAYISKHEADFYKPKHKNIIEIEDGEIINLGKLKINTILTPGHSPGCQCFKYENVLICGDAVFIDGCGRCDLPGGNAKIMYNSLYNIIKKLPDETILFTGHNYGPLPFATVGEQKKTNPYLTCKNQKEFLEQRMGIAF